VEIYGSGNACADLRDHERIIYNEIQHSRMNDQRIQCALQYDYRRRTDYNPQIAILYILSSTDITIRICHTLYTSKHAANIANYLLNLRYGRTLLPIKTILQTDLSTARKSSPYHQFF
jgi:hypothetical protein